jgi:hypothetical protein
MAESLLSVPIGHVSQANAVFGSRPGVLVARPGGRGLSWWFTIPSGYYALVQSYGAQIDHPNGGRVWPAGFYIGGPWMSVSHLVTKQSIIFDSPARDCPTSDDLPVSIDVAVVFRIMGDAEKKEDPNLVQNFIFKVTPTGLKDQLGAALDEAVRGLVRAVRATEVYGLRSGATDNRPGTPESKDGEPDHGDVDAAQAASKKGVGVTEKVRSPLLPPPPPRPPRHRPSPTHPTARADSRRPEPGVHAAGHRDRAGGDQERDAPAAHPAADGEQNVGH